MKLVLSLAVLAISTTAFPSGSTVGNGLVETNSKTSQAFQEKLCADKGGKVKKDTCVMKEKTVKLSELVDEPKAEEAPVAPVKEEAKKTK